MKFTQYLSDKVLCESVIDQLNEEVEIDELNESLELMEAELNEFLGLGKLASKVKGAAEKLGGFSDKADKKIDNAKEAAKKKIEDTKTDIKNTAKGAQYSAERKINAAKKTVSDIGDRATVAKDELVAKKNELKAKFTSVLKKSKDVFAKFGEEAISALKPAQKELAVELAPLFTKMKKGRAIGGEQALMVIAAVLAGVANADGGFPTKSEYEKKLSYLRGQPGLASFAFTAKYNGEVEEEEAPKKEEKVTTPSKPAAKKPTMTPEEFAKAKARATKDKKVIG